MTLLIGADVLLRNVGLGGIAPSNEISEDIIYLLTLLAAPGLLRQGQHIRVDIVLRMLPARAGWLLEWLGDILGVICCLYFVWYGARVAIASFTGGALSIKTLIMPEWWLLAPMPLSFVMLNGIGASNHHSGMISVLIESAPPGEARNCDARAVYQRSRGSSRHGKDVAEQTGRRPALAGSMRRTISTRICCPCRNKPRQAGSRDR